MAKDYSKEVRGLIKEHKNKGFRYAKPIEFLLKRVRGTKEEIEKELIENNFEFCERQERKGEMRYILYYVYSKKKGRVYVITFEDKIVIITAFPIGKATLKKYKKKFKS